MSTIFATVFFALRPFADASRSALADLTDPARRLALATRRLGDGTGKPVTLEETISLSIDGLAEESPAAVDAFYSLGAFAPKPANFDLAAAQAVAECDVDALALLVERNLLEFNDTDEFLALHQIIADVARTRTPDEATTRHREHYFGRVNNDPENWQAIEAIYPQTQWAWEQIPDMHVMKFNFGDNLSTFQTRRGLWDDMLKWLTVSMHFVERNSDAVGHAFVLLGFGTAYDALGEKKNALNCYEKALLLYRETRDPYGEAVTLNNSGTIYQNLGELEKALVHPGVNRPIVPAPRWPMTSDSSPLGSTGFVTRREQS